MEHKGTAKRFSTELQERAVRMAAEHQPEHGSQWATIMSVSAKIGCTAQSLHRWVAQAERDQGKRAGLSSAERENRELKRANGILRNVSAYFSQAELDRRGR